MTNTDRTFYDAAMAETHSFVAVGHGGLAPRLAVPDADELRLTSAWTDQVFYDVALAEAGIIGSTNVGPAVNPNRPLFPVLGEVQQLPRWARVAYAARCARRVLPIVRHALPEFTDHQFKALKVGVLVAEYSAAGATSDAKATIHAARTAESTADSIANVIARAAARASAYAARSAVYGNSKAIVPVSVDATMTSLYHTVTLGTIHHLAGPARDLELLCRLAKVENWTDDTPVSPAVFGPMWEGVPPKWWMDDVLDGLQSEPTENISQDENRETVKSGAFPG